MKALALKYRPNRFNDLVEQDNIKKILNYQLETKTTKQAYLFVGGSGTGKTTSARIFANELNSFKGNPTEVNAASNNGVDDVRNIIDKANYKSVDSEFSIFIIDECVTGDTEILTDSGFKQIQLLSKTDRVAQYTKQGNIEFVIPIDYIKMNYEGDMYKVSFRNGKKSVLMSPNHVQPLRIRQSKKIKENYIKDCKFSQTNEVIVGGAGTGDNTYLTSFDRLCIACQADGYKGKNNKWELHLSKPVKIERAIRLLEDSKIDFKQYNREKSTSIRFYAEKITKKLKDNFSVNMGIDRAKQFIEEILIWDGSKLSGYPAYYSSIDKDNVDFVAAILTQCGYSGNQNIKKSSNPNHSDLHTINWYYTDSRPASACTKSIVPYRGDIYCVKVPSQMIVLRAEGFTFISGNCHMLSAAAFAAFLKLLEEPPAKTVYIFCTTDPSKIPDTILSRVQRYDFQRISQDGTVNRLKYILKEEGYKED